MSAHPANTTFCLAAGTYVAQSVGVPQEGDRFIGALGAILDGQNTTTIAFSGTAPNVVVQNLVIKNYTAPAQQAPVAGGPGWIIPKQRDHGQRRRCGVAAPNPTASRSSQNLHVHHNLQEGYCRGGGTIASNILLSSNEFAFNNYTDAYDPGWGSGRRASWHFHRRRRGGAQLLARQLWPRGLWTDVDNMDTTYAYNLVENNATVGSSTRSVTTPSSKATSSGTTESRRTCPAWLWCAGIQNGRTSGVPSTRRDQVEVVGNTVVSSTAGGDNGIALIQQNRGSGPYGLHLVQNVWVHDNVVDMSAGGASGGVEDISDDSIFTSRNNRFDKNGYTLGNNGNPFAWMDSWGNASFWQARGLDPNGSFH